MWWIAAMALAAAPDVRVESDGTVVATVLVGAEPAAVRALLADGVDATRLSPDVYGVRATPVGDCQLLDKETRGIFRPFHLRTRRCPTAVGWSETLVGSDDFTAFRSSVEVAPAGSATRVTYRVQTSLAAPVPQAALNRSVSDSARALLDNLVRRLLPFR
jgi:hypothetical protein